MSLPVRYEFEHVTLPFIRKSINDSVYRGTPHHGDLDPGAVRESLFALLGVVHQLADEVYDLRDEVGYLRGRGV